jgi:hypothetical protein
MSGAENLLHLVTPAVIEPSRFENSKKAGPVNRVKGFSEVNFEDDGQGFPGLSTSKEVSGVNDMVSTVDSFALLGRHVTCTVTEYYTKFQHIRHNMIIYNSTLDESFFVYEFLDGLRDDLCAAIWLHQPSDLDTAFRLALLQEEEYKPGKSRMSSR